MLFNDNQTAREDCNMFQYNQRQMYYESRTKKKANVWSAQPQEKCDGITSLSI